MDIGVKLTQQLKKAMDGVLKDVLDDFEPLVVEAFRRRAGKRLAKYGLSTESRVNMMMDEHHIVVTVKLPHQLAMAQDKEAATDAVLGTPERRVPPAKPKV